ncbi:hypothetical protein D3C76_1256970 [compost metagenome]
MKAAAIRSKGHLLYGFVWRCWRYDLEKRSRIYAQSVCKPFNRVQARIGHPAFYAADVAASDGCMVRERFLAEPARKPKLPELLTEALS